MSILEHYHSNFFTQNANQGLATERSHENKKRKDTVSHSVSELSDLRIDDSVNSVGTVLHDNAVQDPRVS